MKIQIAKTLINECGLNITEPLHSKVLDIVNEALEKQVPKKVRRYDNGAVLCPVCGVALLNVTYCYDCGQKLDWEHKESED